MTESPFRAVLKTALDSALRHLDSLSGAPAAATATLPELRSRLGKTLDRESLAAEQVLEELVRDTEGGLLGSAEGRFFAWAIGGSVPAALGADWLTSAWDQNAALYSCAPAAAIVEEVAGSWLKQILGLPADASFAFVSGCQMAHVTCLAAARHELLLRRDWDVEARGIAGSPQIQVLASNRHASSERAVRLLGTGERNVLDLALDETERVAPETLESALQTNAGRPTIVVLQAGDLNTGTFDRFEDLLPIARHYAAWVHVDGAFGLWASATGTRIC